MAKQKTEAEILEEIRQFHRAKDLVFDAMVEQAKAAIERIQFSNNPEQEGVLKTPDGITKIGVVHIAEKMAPEMHKNLLDDAFRHLDTPGSEPSELAKAFNIVGSVPGNRSKGLAVEAIYKVIGQTKDVFAAYRLKR